MTFVVLDIETTGLNVRKDRIIELGALKVKDGQIIDTFDSFLKPDVLIPTDATEINHITNDMIKKADLPGVVLLKFHEFIKDADFLVGHNIKRFDYPFLAFEFERNFIKFRPFKLKDTVYIARRKLKGLRSYSLSALRRIFNITPAQAHRALSDVEDTLQIYFELTKR